MSYQYPSPIFAFDPVQHDHAMDTHEAANQLGKSIPGEHAPVAEDVHGWRDWAAAIAAASIVQGNSAGNSQLSSPSVPTPLHPAHAHQRSSAPYAFPPMTSNHSATNSFDNGTSETFPFSSASSTTVSRPTSRAGKQKLAHSEVERGRRKSIAQGFAQLQQTLTQEETPQQSNGEKRSKLLPKTVLLKQACSTIEDLRVRLEACTTIIANLNGDQADNHRQRTHPVNTAHSSPNKVLSPTSLENDGLMQLERQAFGLAGANGDRSRVPKDSINDRRLSSSTNSSSSSLSSWPSNRSAMTMTSLSSDATQMARPSSVEPIHTSRFPSNPISRDNSRACSPLQLRTSFDNAAKDDHASRNAHVPREQVPPSFDANALSSNMEVRKAIAVLLGCISSSGTPSVAPQTLVQALTNANGSPSNSNRNSSDLKTPLAMSRSSSAMIPDIEID